MYGQHRLDSTAALTLASPPIGDWLGRPSYDSAADLAAAAAKVAALDLSIIAKRMMTAPDGPHWTLDAVHAAERRYRRFLLMTILYPDTPLTPAKDIDLFWHEHILNTKAYWRDCDALFGHYLHHDAGYGSEEKDFAGKAVLDDQTSALYRALFAEPYFATDATEDSYCTISACVEAKGDAAQKVSLVSGDGAYCTISACVEAKGDLVTGKQRASGDGAYCTISACVEAKGDLVKGEQRASGDGAYCTISACVEAKGPTH